jgi:adenylate cyclase
MRCGGEILKFTGDGFLAIFPVLDPENRPCATCGSALDAAEQALALNRALNDRRRVAGLPGLDLDLVLHFGRVVYGNVGTSRRLDFTVIGRAVNEASRIEEL